LFKLDNSSIRKTIESLLYDAIKRKKIGDVRSFCDNIYLVTLWTV